MRIGVENLGANGASFKSLVTEHKGESLTWSALTYGKITFHDVHRLFKEFNECMAKKPMEVQDTIFAAYRRIHTSLKSTGGNELAEHLQTIRKDVKIIYDHFTKFDADEMLETAVVRYPKTMSSEFVVVSGGAGRTYLTSDYKALVRLSLRHRAVVPIFGQYMVTAHNDKSLGSAYTVSSAVSILDLTDMDEDPAMDKLYEYMDATLQKFAPQATAAVHRGLGSDELPYWLAKNAVFRRVAIGELDNGDDLSSIVTNVYNLIKTILESMGRNFGITRLKTRVPESSATEENISHLEAVRVSQALADGDKTTINVAYRDGYNYARVVDPTVPQDLVIQCITHTGEWAAQTISRHQKLLPRWILSRSNSPWNIDCIGRESLMTAIGVTQALLYHWGYKTLASLMTAVPHVDVNMAPTTSLYPVDELPKETVKQLSELYPYYKATGKKDQSVDFLNPGFIGVNNASQAICQSDWRHTRPDWMEREIAISDVGLILIPPNLKLQLAEVLIKSVTELAV